MEYDLSKLHPIHRKSFNEFINSEFKDARTSDGRFGRDVLYEQYLDLNQTVPDIIGKHEHQMTKAQKLKYRAKVKDIEDKRQQNRRQ